VSRQKKRRQGKFLHDHDGVGTELKERSPGWSNCKSLTNFLQRLVCVFRPAVTVVAAAAAAA